MKRIAVVALAFALVMGVHASSGPASGVVTQEWVARYNGPGNGWDHAAALAVDGSGNVYVTGNAYSASTNNDYTTVKYDSGGTQQWIKTYNGPGNSSDSATALALDGSGNVYVTGGSYSNSTGTDYATVKYDSAGTQQWVKRWEQSGTDLAMDLAVDGSGNVYVTGRSDYWGGTADDIWTVKYDTDGNFKWSERYNGPGNNTDWPQDITVVGSSAIYVAGYSYQGASTGIDYTMVRYGSDGKEWWVHNMNCTANGQDEALAVAVDGSDNSYFTGYCDNGGTNLDDYATVKLDALGVSGWTRYYNSGTNHTDYGLDVAVDGSGNVYVTGTSYSGWSTGYDYATVKYDSAGTQQWVKTYNGTGNGWDGDTALALDGSGNVYVTGGSIGTGGEDDVDYATVEYDSAGTEQWAIRYNGSANGADSTVALAVDGSGNVYVTGTSYGGASTNYDYATVKYSQAGGAGVGGIAELPDVAPGGAQPSDAPPEGSGWSGGTYAALAAGVAAAALALAGAGWYARRRWLKA